MNLIQELHGLIVNQLEKLEINLIVEVAGLLVPLLLWVIEFVLPLIKLYKQESHLTT